jgi:sugar phosphate isomerase/epimerase
VKAHLDLSRRQFLQTAAIAASALPLATARAEERASRSPGKPQVGCLSWCFHNLGPAADPEAALDIIGILGFDGVELIVTARRDLKEFWTDARIDRLNGKLQRNKLRVSQFVILQPVVEDLSSTDRTARERALDYFEAGWTLLQGEYPPLAIHKVGAHLTNVHMREIDGVMRQSPPFGRGVIDIEAIVTALGQVGFNGFASIEQDQHPGDPDIRETCREYLRIMREYI